MKTTGTHTFSGIARVASIGAIASVISLTTAVAGQGHFSSGQSHLNMGQSHLNMGQPHFNYNLNRRAENQIDHVQQGIKSGSLTRTEAQRIRSFLQNIRAKVSAARAANGGKLTTAERKQVLHAQNRAARKIYQLKHNQNPSQ
jgi:multidrug resistance efflux pump